MKEDTQTWNRRQQQWQLKLLHFQASLVVHQDSCASMQNEVKKSLVALDRRLYVSNNIKH
jgi:hypothetical protein